MNMLPSQEFVFYRTYARWIENQGRRETWPETVTRYVQFLQEERGSVVPEKVYNKIYDAILNLEVMPSMRALWAAGDAARKDNVCMYNCLGRETEFITSTGPRTFYNYRDGDSVTVLTHTGAWQKATVRNYGRQDLYSVTFRNGTRGRTTIRATQDHRWLLESGEETTALRVKDTPMLGPDLFHRFDFDSAAPMEQLYWAYGFVYGDGTLVRDKEGIARHSMVRLCGTKVRFRERFEALGFSTSTSASLSGDFIAYTGRYLKTLPDMAIDSPELIRAFIAGYFDADGAKRYTPAGVVPASIQATGEEAIAFLRNALPVAGLYITREDEVPVETNYGSRSGPTRSFAVRSHLTRKSNAAWVVEDISVEPVARGEDVWCLEVENDHSFVLAGGIVTGNCSFQAIDSIDAFAECLYILMCGTGYGFSVSQEHVSQLPVVPIFQGEGAGIYVIDDSREGWADSVKQLVSALYMGRDIEMDYSGLRHRGARLRTMGGRSSGPGPLINLHAFIREVFSDAQGRRLKTIEVHDILNQIAEIVVVGGVRRSSQISLSDLFDEDMRWAKDHPFPLRRAMANNSAIYHSKPTAVEFLREWAALAASGTGERGIFNLAAARDRAPKRRDASKIMGVNPCAEINLRSRGFCNLSEVVVRPEDDLDSLLEKVETATWIGAIQSTFTNFPYLSEQWKKNAQEERLLGVSITGQMDNPKVLSAEGLAAMKSRVLKVAKRAATALDINIPAATTCVKPSGTVSELVNASAGVHPRYAPYYIRRYRISATDPIINMLRAQGIALTPETGQRREDWDRARKLFKTGENYTRACTIFNPKKDWSPDDVMTWVIEFPIKAPKGAITRADVSAIDQLEHYAKVQTNWCEHNASCTVYVRPEEWFEVGSWVYRQWDLINGVSFLPYDAGHYEQTPYEEITREQYEAACKSGPKIDFTRLSEFEKEDTTQGSQELACTGDKCTI